MIEPINESSILKIIGEKLLYIHDLIDLAFEIKRKLRSRELDFSVLIQPYSGSEWENLTMMIPYLPREIVEENLDQLLEGFMDLNWPGSRILYGYLAEIDIHKLKNSFDRVIDKAIEKDDTEWVYFLCVFMNDERVGMKDSFIPEIEKSRSFLKSHDMDYD
ncbi:MULTISPECIES: DUF5071 domain-containing protein [Acinetobacter]|uniref:DUF5071 domain-containing protein n=1 Tax=Acinetobacter TaxID=469 RepID=UPI0006296739|nr:DUF5071 domain-containing protein [Acinetobacter sp. AG1]KKW79966.1 hypothetical protein AAV96_06835 [Acinetobacter sp. AG1]